MPTHGSVAKNVREHKERHPELYCSKCLWRTGGGDCPRHAAKPTIDIDNSPFDLKGKP